MSALVQLKPGKRDRARVKEVISGETANELFFALVGPAGAGCTQAAKALIRTLEETKVGGTLFRCERIKASDLIREWAELTGRDVPSPAAEKTPETVKAFQDCGDEMRDALGQEAVAVAAVEAIMKKRAEFMEARFADVIPIHPDERPRAYIIDSLKNPAEARLLREVYGDAFVLVGVVCDDAVRERRLLGAFFTERRLQDHGDECRKKVHDLMRRDSGENQEDFGQKVTDTFHESDFFVDNSENDPEGKKTYLYENFGRLIDLLLHREIQRPTIEETAMHSAYSAQLRSQCLSRQVGACLIDVGGNILATGTNEVPRPGGGVYGECSDHEDNRCLSSHKFCSSNIVQNEIIAEIVKSLGVKDRNEADAAAKKLRGTSVGRLIEFSRAVHAEMDAILSAARSGANIVGARLFVSTFPCHYCARHIVTAGISEVQYIEPYPKSRALELHSDSITTKPEGWIAPGWSPSEDADDRAASDDTERVAENENRGKVLFRPFVGVAPRLYPRVFRKDRPYKNKETGEFLIGDASGSNPWQLRRISYADLEVKLVKSFKSE